ncbi:trans-resveratrol di-O-methyltransferase [Salvia divinorum]|uniref:Trans-resveratrol di-O-methyltransferase n=1 Tax=Salvia divinorum TaxID=28513 RepID=A0ABD1IBZ5_SALDI
MTSPNHDLTSQAHVWNHLFSYINSMSLKCAIQLGIPDAIDAHGGPMPLSRLSAALSVPPAKSDALRRLMRLLVHSKFFEKVSVSDSNEDAYVLTGASCLLLRRGAMSMAPFALVVLDRVSVDPWHEMGEWLRDGRASMFETEHGSSFWEYAEGSGRLDGLFNEGMASDAGCVAGVLGRDGRRVFEGVGTVVDVGGGIGATARGFAAEFPGSEWVVLDLPRVVEGLEGSEKLRFVGGDMIESIPQADAVFLKWVLHDWSDEDCVKILKNCKEAISTKGGKVILVELVVEDREEDDKATETQLLFDLKMMAVINGKERNEKEWAKLFFAAGFGNYKITPVLGLRSIIEVFP